MVRFRTGVLRIIPWLSMHDGFRPVHMPNSCVATICIERFKNQNVLNKVMHCGEQQHEEFEVIWIDLVFLERMRAEDNKKNNGGSSTSGATSQSLKLMIPDESTLSRLVAARLDLPISQSLLAENFKLSIIKRCWEDQLRLKRKFIMHSGRGDCSTSGLFCCFQMMISSAIVIYDWLASFYKCRSNTSMGKRRISRYQASNWSNWEKLPKESVQVKSLAFPQRTSIMYGKFLLFRSSSTRASWVGCE